MTKTPEQVFAERSRNIYAGMKKRAEKEHVKVGFDLESFRWWLRGYMIPNIAGAATCIYSGERLPIEQVCVDHKTPISRGGSFDLLNLAICSERENLRKGNMEVGEYVLLQNFVKTIHPAAQESIWRRLQVGDVQRFNYFRRKAKKRG